MHSRRETVRFAMSLLQNYTLRSTIDRTLSGAGFAGNVLISQRNLRTGTHLKKGNDGPEQAVLDKESLSKLNELKQGLQMKNEYFEKYKDKLKKFETNSPKELLAKLEQLDDQRKDDIRRFQSAEQSAKKPKSLDDVMRMDSLKPLERDDIIHLWQEFHRHKEGLLAAVMSGAVYDKMKNLASTHTTFVMPLPRPDGHEFFLMQFDDNTFHFTPLIMYQTHKDNAPVALRLINYTDLKSSKDLVLLRGEYDPKCLKAEDAHFLAVQTNFYYGETSESRINLLKNFTSNPEQFQHMQLIDELKKIEETHSQLFEFEQSNKPNLGST